MDARHDLMMKKMRMTHALKPSDLNSKMTYSTNFYSSQERLPDANATAFNNSAASLYGDQDSYHSLGQKNPNLRQNTSIENIAAKNRFGNSPSLRPQYEFRSTTNDFKQMRGSRFSIELDQTGMSK